MIPAGAASRKLDPAPSAWALSYAGLALVAVLAVLGDARAQAPAPAAAPTAAPAPPPSPVAAIRNKIPAGDLLGRVRARGVPREERRRWRGSRVVVACARARCCWATWAKRRRTRRTCARRRAAAGEEGHARARPRPRDRLGAAIETDAQRLERTKGKQAAARCATRSPAPPGRPRCCAGPQAVASTAHARGGSRARVGSDRGLQRVAAHARLVQGQAGGAVPMGGRVRRLQGAISRARPRARAPEGQRPALCRDHALLRRPARAGGGKGARGQRVDRGLCRRGGDPARHQHGLDDRVRGFLDADVRVHRS